MNIFIERGPVVLIVVQVHLHTVEEGLDERLIYLILMYHLLKIVEDRVAAEPVPNRLVGSFFKVLQFSRLIRIVKSVHQLVGQPNKSIYAANRVA
jgi:hypothetical protein